MAHRVERKLHAKTANSGPISRLFVAYPEPRDDVVRAPFVPKSVIEKRDKQNNKMDVDLSQFRDEKMRKLEREIELEMGDKYFLDLKKHYLLKNENEKYDIVPEVWEGHNVADFITPEILAQFKKIEEEEKLRTEAGFYDEDLDSDDEETRELLKDAAAIEEKEALFRMEHIMKKVDRPQVSRKLIRKRERTLTQLEDEMGDLGVDLKKRKMDNFKAAQQIVARGKKIKVGRSHSLEPKRATPRNELLTDLEVSILILNFTTYYDQNYICNVFSSARSQRRPVFAPRNPGKEKPAREKPIVVSWTPNQNICSLAKEEWARPTDVNSISNIIVNPSCYKICIVIKKIVSVANKLVDRSVMS